MGKYKPFILLGVAIIVALAATLLISSYLKRQARLKQVPLETLPIAVAKVDMSWGTVLTAEMIATKLYLKSTLPGGFFSDPASLSGRVLISNIKANEPIFESKLAPVTVKTGGVAAVISPKKRAVSIKVDKVIGVSGFIHPGNRVDVLVTLHSEKGQTPTAKTVLENILVLAAGPEIQTKGKEEKASPVEVITLEVTPEEAEKVALAATEGRILLALRNFNDTEDVVTKGITIPTLLGSYSAYNAPTEAKAVPAKTKGVKKPVPAISKNTETEKATPSKPAFVVEVIKGTKSSNVKFEGGE